jgi:hypothetical protein
MENMNSVASLQRQQLLDDLARACITQCSHEMTTGDSDSLLVLSIKI